VTLPERNETLTILPFFDEKVFLFLLLFAFDGLEC
jgi:hypothetical protein